MATPRIELFYDIVSPYSRLALVVLERYVPRRWPVELVLRPAFLGGVMKAVGNVPPATLPQRAPYLLRDIGRLSSYVGVPMQLPEEFPGNTLNAMRFMVVVARERPELHSKVAHALYGIHWGEGRAVNTPEVLVEGAVRAGMSEADATALVGKTGDAETKELLKAATDEVVGRGAFGFPAIFVSIDGQDEMFFGHDRLSLLAHCLGLPWEGPNPA